MRLLALAVVASLGAGCLRDPREGQGAGYVVGGAVEHAQVVRVAWVYATAAGEDRATLHGQAPIEDAQFDIDVLVAEQEGFAPPTRGCSEQGYYEGLGTVAVGRLVATEADLGDVASDLPIESLPSVALAAALDIVVAWASDDVARDSVDGQRLESALSAGYQLGRLRPCQAAAAAACQGVEDLRDQGSLQDLCIDPWPDDGIVLLDDWDGTF